MSTYGICGEDKCENEVYSKLEFNTEWLTLPLNWARFASLGGYTPKYRKCGNIVEINGIAVGAADNIDGTDTGTYMFALPEGYRPDQRVDTICQAGGKNTWLCTVMPNGQGILRRYGLTNFISPVPQATNLYIHVMFTVTE